MSFEFSKTPNKKALIFSPYEMRPGTFCQVTFSYVNQTTPFIWDSDTSLLTTVLGVPYKESIKSPFVIPEENITISGSNISILPIFHGPIELNIYYKLTKTVTILSRSSITVDDNQFYNDWFYDDEGNAVPMTVLPLDLPDNEKIYSLEDFQVIWPQEERGITILEGDIWTSNNNGRVRTLDFTDDFGFTRNLFRKGLTEVIVPLECTIEPVIRPVAISGDLIGRSVKVDLQEWNDPIVDVRGILWHRDYLYVLTSNGLYRFYRWGKFDKPDKHFPLVTGNDLTYAIGDTFLVTENKQIKIYRVKHDFIHVSRDTDTITMREQFPDLTIGE